MYDELKEKCRACSQGCIYPSDCSYFDKPPLRCMRQLLSEAADAIESMSEAYDKLSRHMDDLAALMPRWIPVSERLPEKSGRYLVIATEPWFDSTYTEIMRYLAGENLWFYDGRITEAKITHWMPLPVLTKEEE